jgi:hypothetical protein
VSALSLPQDWLHLLRLESVTLLFLLLTPPIISLLLMRSMCLISRTPKVLQLAHCRQTVKVWKVFSLFSPVSSLFVCLVGTSFTPTATATSGLPVTITASTACSILNGVVTFNTFNQVCFVICSVAANNDYYASNNFGTIFVNAQGTQTVSITRFVCSFFF